MHVEIESKNFHLIFEIQVHRDRDEQGSFISYEAIKIISITDVYGKERIHEMDDKLVNIFFESFKQRALYRAQEIHENVRGLVI